MPTHSNLQKYIQTIGNGADTSIVVRHNIGNRHVVVQLRQNEAPFEFIYTGIRLDPNDVGNAVIINFSVAPKPDEFVVIVIG